MIPLDALQVLDAIARRGSFAAAAEELHRVPSAITYMVKKIEDQLEVRLFDRAGQRAVLTSIGTIVLKEGRIILQQLRRLEEHVQQVERGCETELRIVVDTILPLDPLWPLLQKFLREQPYLNIQVMEEALSGSWEALVSQRADLAIGVAGDEPAGGQWHKCVIGQVGTVLCCGNQHPAAQLSQPISHKQLENFTHIVINDSAQNLPARNVGLLGLKQVLSVANMIQKYQALIHNMGISHLPAFLAKKALEQGRLIQLMTKEENHPQTLFMAWPKEGTGEMNKRLRETIVELNLFERLL